MSAALLARQRNDGFWNANLADTLLYAGKETSGTALFVYGMAWGINNNILSRATYLNAVKKGLVGHPARVHPSGQTVFWGGCRARATILVMVNPSAIRPSTEF